MNGFGSFTQVISRESSAGTAGWPMCYYSRGLLAFMLAVLQEFTTAMLMSIVYHTAEIGTG